MANTDRHSSALIMLFLTGQLDPDWSSLESFSSLVSLNLTGNQVS